MRRIMDAVGIRIPTNMSLEEMVDLSLSEGAGLRTEREYDFRYNEDMMAIPLNSDDPSRMGPTDYRLPFFSD